MTQRINKTQTYPTWVWVNKRIGKVADSRLQGGDRAFIGQQRDWAALSVKQRNWLDAVKNRVMAALEISQEEFEDDTTNSYDDHGFATGAPPKEFLPEKPLPKERVKLIRDRPDIGLKQKWDWYGADITDKRLNAADIKLLWVLYDQAWAEDRKWMPKDAVKLSYEKLAEFTRLARSTVQAATKKLETLGYFAVEITNGGRGQANLYTGLLERARSRHTPESADDKRKRESGIDPRNRSVLPPQENLPGNRQDYKENLPTGRYVSKGNPTDSSVTRRPLCHSTEDHYSESHCAKGRSQATEPSLGYRDTGNFRKVERAGSGSPAPTPVDPPEPDRWFKWQEDFYCYPWDCEKKGVDPETDPFCMEMLSDKLVLDGIEITVDELGGSLNKFVEYVSRTDTFPGAKKAHARLWKWLCNEQEVTYRLDWERKEE